jgi:calcium-dependent protein kinase
VGVIAYILLSGTPPFGGRNEKQIMENVKGGQYNFNNAVWNNVSDDAKDFVKKLLTMDPAHRMSAKEALNHKWLMQVIKMDIKKSRVGVT